MTVLCVDDDEAFLELEVEMLELRADDVDAVPVSSAPAALDVLAERDVDCVVSDFDMPEMTGLEFLEAVAERFPRLPFILHTGKGSEEIASEAISAGVADYIQKSGGAEQYDLLANRIRNAVGHTRESVQRERTEQWYRQLFEQRIIGVAISQDGEFVQANQKFADILGYDRSDVVGMTAMDVVAADDRDRVARALRKREDGEVDSVHYVVTAVRADGERVDRGPDGIAVFAASVGADAGCRRRWARDDGASGAERRAGGNRDDCLTIGDRGERTDRRRNSRIAADQRPARPPAEVQRAPRPGPPRRRRHNRGRRC